MDNINENIIESEDTLDNNEQIEHIDESGEQLNNNEHNKIVFEPKTKNDKFKVDCWHTEKNGDLTPRDVSKTSRKTCWFLCDVCGHDFQRTIKHIVMNNKWCHYCYENIVCDNDECEVCYNNSFASFGE